MVEDNGEAVLGGSAVVPVAVLTVQNQGIPGASSDANRLGVVLSTLDP